ncbi:anaerobic ribonucleoside-triphosphate reductase-activating protein [Shewanella sp. 10N.286.52.A9]|uniref:anaerobic ribonucleoside-triphosphate reductase-activating protein n=1 Tax=Shewanella sp. 10N.286.52.A9 TaxID=3229711 RepID=UPI00354E8CB1
MNFHQYYSVDVVNGPGTRCTLFVAGCEHQCRGCYNQSTWDPRSGNEFTQAMEDQVIADLQDTRIKRRGLSLSGGDPLFADNLPAMLALVKRVKRECPDKDIWLWSGYQLAEMSLKQQQVLAYVDVLIDGKFEQDLADPSLKWKGSANQVVHDLSQLIVLS